MNRATIASLAARSRPIVTPLAHDALSARLIEMAELEVFTVGGSAMLAARHAMPDIGPAALADMADGTRDIAAATRLPFRSAAMFEGGDTPWLMLAVLGGMGFGHVSFPAAIILRAVAAMESALAGIRAHADGSAAMEAFAAFGRARQTLDDAVRLDHWRAIEGRAAGGSGR
jgi:2-methylisocitrate lyase-like PEP mutase family enzyme